MINSKITKAATQQTTEDRFFKLLESMDWKLWEMMNMLKDNLPEKEKPAAKPLKAVKKAAE
jgi:succinate dehydrogenase flavin-adding protein (antitoxin of CptAB toxin-antitoxin module)